MAEVAPQVNPCRLGDVAPDFEVNSTEGMIKLSDYCKGLVNFHVKKKGSFFCETVGSFFSLTRKISHQYVQLVRFRK